MQAAVGAPGVGVPGAGVWGVRGAGGLGNRAPLLLSLGCPHSLSSAELGVARGWVSEDHSA